MKEHNLEDRISKFAELIIKVGLNLQPGQRLFIWANLLETAPLVRQVVQQAYQGGSRLVTVLWNDEATTRIRFDHAPRDSFDEYPAWKAEARLESIAAGDAMLWIGGDTPGLLKGIEPDLIAAADNARARLHRPVLERIGKNEVQWLVACPPTPAWARAVFPEADPAQGEQLLWEAVIKACRLDTPSPVQSWQKNLDALVWRAGYLTDRQYNALHFTAPGTDLRVGLPENHLWLGGWDVTPEGIQFCGNIPTEEIYTLPHRERVDGTVRATRPLSFRGSLIEDFQLRFEKGRVVEFQAEKGEEILKGLLEADPNARYLGEVALVPHSSPISSQELVFLNTLYDENASNHLALGNAYRVNLAGGAEMSGEQFSAAGGNQSMMHEDFMFGSGQMDVDGILPGGASEALMRGGEWVLD